MNEDKEKRENKILLFYLKILFMSVLMFLVSRILFQLEFFDKETADDVSIITTMALFIVSIVLIVVHRKE